MTHYILLTIDVEEWFQVENFKSYIDFSTWSYQQSRVEKSVRKLLNLFDLIPLKTPGTENTIKATFLSWDGLPKSFPALFEKSIHEAMK